MKKLLLLMLLITSSVFAGTSSLLHFDSNYTDAISGVVWTPGGTYGISPDAAFSGAGGLQDTGAISATSGNLTAASVDAFKFGTQDYTIEYYYRVNSTTHTAESIIPNFFYLTVDAANYLVYYPYITTTPTSNFTISLVVDAWSGGVNTGSLVSTTVTMAYDRWMHICAERRSGVLYLYINGRQVGTTANAAAIYNLAGVTSVSFSRIMQAKSFVGTFDMDEFKANINGYVYGGEFTPDIDPTPPGYITKMKFENNIIDDTGRTWAQAYSGGWTGFSNTIYKRDDYSMYGTSGYIISYESGTDYDLAGDFTVQYWAAFDADAVTWTATPFYLMRFYTSGATNNLGCYYGISRHPSDPAQYVPAIQTHTTAAGTNNAVGTTWETGTNWHHLCYERRGDTIYCYLDGVEMYNFVDASVFDTQGAFVLAEVNGAYATGRIHVDQLSVYRGGYLYGGEFLPTERPRASFAERYFDTNSMPDPYTKNLLHLDTSYDDVSGDDWLPTGAWYVSAPGNSLWTISPSAAKFGSGGIYDACRPQINWGILKADIPSKFWYGTGDFTIEWWQRITSITSTGNTTNMMDFFAAQNASNYWQLYTRYSPVGLGSYNVVMGAAVLSGGAWQDVKQSGAVTVNVGDWVHCAASRVSGTLKLFINGTNVLNVITAAGTYNFNSTLVQEVSMQRVYNGASTLNCVMNFDEFRAANYGIYTSNFTPPTTAYGLLKDNKIGFYDGQFGFYGK